MIQMYIFSRLDKFPSLRAVETMAHTKVDFLQNICSVAQEHLLSGLAS